MFRSALRPRLLVSSCNIGGALYVVEFHGKSARVKRISDEPSIGLSRAPDGRILVAHLETVTLLDRRLRSVGLPYQLGSGSDAHDVKWLPDGGFAAVETSLNRVAGYTKDGTRSWTWAAIEGEGDLCHVNSVLLDDGGWLVTMFTPEGLGEPWRERLDGALMTFSPSTPLGGSIVRRGFQHPHSLNLVDGHVWMCESKLKRVIRFSLADSTAPIETVVEIDGYARGLHVTDEWLFVGQSRSDVGRSFVNPLMGNAPLISTRCGVWAIKRDGTARIFAELPSNEVYDIIALED